MTSATSVPLPTVPNGRAATVPVLADAPTPLSRAFAGQASVPTPINVNVVMFIP